MNQNPEKAPPEKISAQAEEEAKKKVGTIGRIFSALGKTAVSKGIKKTATWLATKLGLQGAITALGAAASGVTAGVSLAISTIINLAIKFGKKILGPIWEKIKSGIVRLVQKPEEALGWFLAGGLTLAAGFFTALPMPIALVGVVPFTVGGMALISWGAASVGTIVGGFAAKTTAFFTALTTAPSTAPIALLITAILGVLAALTFFIVMTTAGAFIVPIEPTKPVEVYFDVTKSIDRNQFDNNELPATVTYTITVTAKDSPITITSIYDQRNVNCQGSPPSINPKTDIPPPSGPITNWSTSYSLDFNGSFADCSLCNTVSVIANVEGGPVGQMASDGLCVIIGNPPEDCPQGWPTDTGGIGITQGPNTPCDKQGWCTSHCNDEAIDIGVSAGTPVKSTHKGEVVQSNWGSDTVKIQGICQGKQFFSYYTHLQRRNVRPGDTIKRGDLIGLSGVGGTGAHLHYEFEGLKMVPHIPAAISQGCCGVCGTCHNSPCGVNW